MGADGWIAIYDSEQLQNQKVDEKYLDLEDFEEELENTGYVTLLDIFLTYGGQVYYRQIFDRGVVTIYNDNMYHCRVDHDDLDNWMDKTPYKYTDYIIDTWEVWT